MSCSTNVFGGETLAITHLRSIHIYIRACRSTIYKVNDSTKRKTRAAIGRENPFGIVMAQPLRELLVWSMSVFLSKYKSYAGADMVITYEKNAWRGAINMKVKDQTDAWSSRTL